MKRTTVFVCECCGKNMSKLETEMHKCEKMKFECVLCGEEIGINDNPREHKCAEQFKRKSILCSESEYCEIYGHKFKVIQGNEKKIEEKWEKCEGLAWDEDRWGGVEEVL
jgi:hypothetical protein